MSPEPQFSTEELAHQEIHKLREQLEIAVRLRCHAESNLDHYRHYICNIGRYLWGNRDAYAPDAVCRKVMDVIDDLSKLADEISKKRPWPDIGPDPIQQRNLVEQDEDAPRRRLSRGVDIQQEHVPDQTALVWRADLNWVSMELIWRRAGFRSMKQWIDNLVPAIKEYIQWADSIDGVPIAPECETVLKKFIEIYEKKEIPGQKESETPASA